MNFIKTIFAAALGFLLTLAVVFVFCFILISAAVVSGSGGQEVKDNTVLQLDLGLDVPDRVSLENASFAALAGQAIYTTSLDRIIWGLKKAAKDDHIKGVILRSDIYSGGFASAKEIRNQILDFRKTGKFVYAYGEVFTEKGYYIASACDSIFLNPTGILELNGIAASIVMYKGMLEKLGIEFQVFKVGKYKGAVEPYIKNEISPENRSQLNDYISSLMTTMVADIGHSRKIDTAKLYQDIVNFEARSPQLAVDLKFIDKLLYEDEVFVKAALKAKNDVDKFKPFPFAKYAETELDYGDNKDKIAVVFATGEIGLGQGDAESQIMSKDLVNELRKVRQDKNVKALVLRVNSPGGSSNASDIIAREIALIKKKMPVIVSFGNVAASGGYYISCLADSIFAQPNTITGSIGVFALIANPSKLYKEKLGLGYETVSTGEFAELGRPDRALTANQGQFIQNMVNTIYSDFLSIVARGRKMDTAQVALLAQGHIYSGIRAKELGLVDQIGGLQDAIAAASLKAGIKDYEISMRPRLKSIFEKFIGPQVADMKVQATIPSYLQSMHKHMTQVQNLVNNPTHTYMLLPYELTLF